MDCDRVNIAFYQGLSCPRNVERKKFYPHGAYV
jgi:hypothetical protein